MLSQKEKILIELVNEHKHLASKEGLDAINENLGFDEWERAYEILILELIEQNVWPKEFDKNSWKQLLLDFEIHKYGYDTDVMNKFETWANQKN